MMRLPQFVQMGDRTYEVKAIHALKTGERIVYAILQHPILGPQVVHSPSIRIRLAHKIDHPEESK